METPKQMLVVVSVVVGLNVCSIGLAVLGQWLFWYSSIFRQSTVGQLLGRQTPMEIWALAQASVVIVFLSWVAFRLWQYRV